MYLYNQTGYIQVKVRLKDIAQRAGLSVTAVSRALADKGDISQKTKDKVRKLADSMGYIPNRNARNMVTGESKTIGLLVSQLYNPVRAEFCIKFNKFLTGCGYQLLICENEPENYQWLLQHDLDALFAGMIVHDDQVRVLEGLVSRRFGEDFPLFLFGKANCNTAEMLILDQENNGYRLGKHLISAGCRNIVIVSHTRNSHSRREDGVKKALLEHGLPEPDFMLYKPQDELADICNAMTSWLQQCKKLPDGFIFHDDYRAFAALAAMRDCGIRIPDDCLAASFDNISQCEYFFPRLTSIGFDNDQLVERLWQKFTLRLDGKKQSARDCLEAILHCRESSQKK